MKVKRDPPTTAATLQACLFSSPIRKRNALFANNDCERGDSADCPCLFALSWVLLRFNFITAWSWRAQGSVLGGDASRGRILSFVMGLAGSLPRGTSSREKMVLGL